MKMESIRLSVIVPMYNAASMIERCLAPLLRMLARLEIAELIVVNDASTDDSASIVATYPLIRLSGTPANSGPGAARNLAASLACGTHLWFVDSDVVVADNAAVILRDALSSSGADAVFGCYDDSPGASNFLSQYKNLVHRYYHARANRDAATFWAGCGAVERSIFLTVGGFDSNRFPHPSIEDIDLGYRIRDAGGRIALEPALQGKHLKEWRLRSLLHTEIFRRALPWARLMLERKGVTNDLNVGVAERLRAVAAGAAVLMTLAWAGGVLPGAAVLAGLAVTLLFNLEFLRFFVQVRGLRFALGAFAYHQLYYLYSSAAFAIAWLQHVVRRRSPERPVVPSR